MRSSESRSNFTSSTGMIFRLSLVAASPKLPNTSFPRNFSLFREIRFKGLKCVRFRMEMLCSVGDAMACLGEGGGPKSQCFHLRYLSSNFCGREVLRPPEASPNFEIWRDKMFENLCIGVMQAPSLTKQKNLGRT